MARLLHAPLFRGRHFPDDLIILAVRWYLRYSLSYRDFEEILAERGVAVDHTTVWRWVDRYRPEPDQRLRRHLRPTGTNWRANETYIRAAREWVDFYLSETRDAAAAELFLHKAMAVPGRMPPRASSPAQSGILVYYH